MLWKMVMINLSRGSEPTRRARVTFETSCDATYSATEEGPLSLSSWWEEDTGEAKRCNLMRVYGVHSSVRVPSEPRVRVESGRFRRLVAPAKLLESVRGLCCVPCEPLRPGVSSGYRTLPYIPMDSVPSRPST